MGRLVHFTSNNQRLADIDLTGYNSIVRCTRDGINGASTPTTITLGSHRVESWAIGNSKTFTFVIDFDYKPGTIIYPCVHWRVGSTNPSTTQVVQWNLAYGVSKSYTRGAYNRPATAISLVDSPSGYDFNEVSIATAQQAISVADIEIGSVIEMTVTRVTPTTGTSFSGTVLFDSVRLIYQCDGALTTGFLYPPVKVF